MAADTPVFVWGCIPQPERTIASVFANAQRTGIGFLVAAGVDLLFAATFPTWWEQRRDAWKGNWGIGVITVEVGGVEVSAYVPLIDWVTPLIACEDAGGCSAAANDCQTRPAWI